MRPTRVAGLLGVALATGVGSAVGAQPPRCLARAEVVPARAVVGQQLTYTVHVQQRHDVSSVEWEQPLGFPAFRAEWLPGISGDVPVEIGGRRYDAFRERRALFPGRAGELEIPAAALRCGGPDGEEIVAVPALRVQVAAVPERGRPPDWRGLIGPVTVHRNVAPAGVAVGESLRVSVVVQGSTNLWAAGDPGAPLHALPDVEVFPRPAELARDTGRRLRVRRYFSYDLVPHAPGPLLLPALRVPYYDPARGRYETASAPPVRVQVAPGAAAALPDPRPEGADRSPDSGGGPAGALLLVLLLGGTVLWLIVARFRRAAEGVPSSPDGLLAEARAAAAAGDRERWLRAAQRAVEAALAASPRADGPAAGEARALLAELERARFAADAAPPELARVEALLAAL